MADGTKNTTNNAVELEAKRKEDASWHPCQVSLCPSGVGLVVDYENNVSEDIIVNAEEALARLRIRSLPLQGDDCSHIQQGDHILAYQKSQSKSLFLDAEVEKALRVRHSKKVHCRCTFMIKWLHQDFSGTLIVPSSSIMKLATKSINVHPTISAFFDTVKSLSCPSISPFPTVVKDMDCEMDLHELLEKQIKEISNSAGASKKKITEDLLLGVEVDTKGQVQCRAFAASKVSESHFRVPPDQNHLKRTTRSSNKLPTDMGVKEPPPPAPSIQEEFPESRSPLNPLAARAALASLMSKLPQNLELSIYHGEGKCFTYSSDITAHNQATMESLNGNKSYNSCVVNNSSLMNKRSSKIEASVPFIPKPDNIVKSLFSTRRAPGKLELVDASSQVLTKEWENENKAQEVTDASFTCLTAEKKISQNTKVTRLTRAAVQKGTGIPDDDIERKTCVEEMKLSCATNRRRLTRSTVHKEEEILTIETKNVKEEVISANYTKSNSSDQNVTGQESYLVEGKKRVTSPHDDEIELLPTKERKSLVKREQRNKKHDVERKTCATERENSNNKRRLTRSVVHLEAGNKSMEAIQVLEENEISEHVNSDLSGENVIVLDSNVLETKKLISVPLHTEISLSPTEERNKKRKMSSATKTIQNTEGNVAANKESSQGLKRKSTSSLKHELRFSPRLRFLPRTRSQNKS